MTRRQRGGGLDLRLISASATVAKSVSQLDRALDHALTEFERIGRGPGIGRGLHKLPPPVRTVLLVHAAQGIIDNGGLQYFFEADFPGRPPYALFVDAYRAIGADEEADALAAAVKLFPFRDPHQFRHRRNRVLDSFADAKRGGHRPDSPFEPFSDKLCGNEKVWRLLKQYVRRTPATRPPRA